MEYEGLRIASEQKVCKPRDKKTFIVRIAGHPDTERFMGVRLCEVEKGKWIAGKVLRPEMKDEKLEHYWYFKDRDDAMKYVLSDLRHQLVDYLGHGDGSDEVKAIDKRLKMLRPDYSLLTG